MFENRKAELLLVLAEVFLGAIFIGLKLDGAITWSWWWVTAPLWAPIAFAWGFMLIFGAATVTINTFEDLMR
jgi:hypothetical protein